MKKFWNSYPDIKDDLEEVRKIILDNTKDAEKFIQEPIHEIINASGKMLRPAMVLLAAKFGDYHKKQILPLAATIEMLHAATLIHDDIIDESKLRRGVESTQSKYGKDSAVFIGDYLFTKCFTLLSHEYSSDSMQLLAKGIMRICRGELKQYAYRYKNNLNTINYLKIISGKTAALFAMSFYIGAEEAKVPEKHKKYLSQIGFRAGIAFQIIDDCLDYSSNDFSLKKNAMNDLKQGYLTLPIIYALQNDSTGNLESLLNNNAFSENNIKTIYNLVLKNNGVTLSRELAKKYIDKAYSTLYKLPDIDARYVIEELLNKLLKREY